MSFDPRYTFNPRICEIAVPQYYVESARCNKIYSSMFVPFDTTTPKKWFEVKDIHKRQKNRIATTSKVQASGEGGEEHAFQCDRERATNVVNRNPSTTSSVFVCVFKSGESQKEEWWATTIPTNQWHSQILPQQQLSRIIQTAGNKIVPYLWRSHWMRSTSTIAPKQTMTFQLR